MSNENTFIMEIEFDNVQHRLNTSSMALFIEFSTASARAVPREKVFF